MSIKAKIEAILYAAEEPVSAEQILTVLHEAGLVEEMMKPPQAEMDRQSDIPPTEEDRQEKKPVKDTKDKDALKAERASQRARIKQLITEIAESYQNSEHGMEVRAVAGGWRIATKAEHHDVVRSFAKSLKPPVRLSLPALETLAVIAYKQPATAPEISEIRGVDSSGVLATLIDRKLITTAGRKAVVGRPILYKTTKEFLMRFGLNDVGELPSMEEFEKMTQGAGQEELFDRSPLADATGVPDDAQVSLGLTEENAEDATTTSENEAESAG